MVDIMRKTDCKGLAIGIFYIVAVFDQTLRCKGLENISMFTRIIRESIVSIMNSCLILLFAGKKFPHLLFLLKYVLNSHLHPISVLLQMSIDP